MKIGAIMPAKTTSLCLTMMIWITLLLLGLLVSTHGFAPTRGAVAPGSKAGCCCSLSTPHPPTPTFLFSSGNDDENTPSTTTSEKQPVKCPNCDKCDGSGRILGGIPVLLPWWPIKPYRPCPNFIANGGFYERSGQGLDEIAFGRDSTYKDE